MTRLDKKGKEFHINKKVFFDGVTIDIQSVNLASEFAYQMVFGEGFHREHRTGGQASRKKGELFCNTFQGKLAEIVVYNNFRNEALNCGKVDFEIHGKGIWDDSDLIVNGKCINIKSAAHFSNLLLLETKDWDNLGRYIPNIGSNSHTKYDFFILVRIEPDIKKVFRNERLMYSNEVSKDKIDNLISSLSWKYDIVGYINNEQLINVINDNYILPQNSLLNGRVPMDAENYYVQAGDMLNIEILINELKQLQASRN